MGGLVRGTTGFGAAMVMTPLLSLLLGPKTAVGVSLLLESFAAAPMLPAAFRLVRWRLIGPIAAAACLTVPAGLHLLSIASAQNLRRLIALTVILFSLALLSGRRYEGPQRLSTSLALGAVSGAMLGATSMGAPPVILYLLSGPDPAAVTRANLTLYIVVISIAGLLLMGASGLLDGQTLRIAAWLTPGFLVGVLVGSKLFAHLSDARFRRLTIGFMLMIAIGVILV